MAPVLTGPSDSGPGGAALARSSLGLDIDDRPLHQLLLVGQRKPFAEDLFDDVYDEPGYLRPQLFGGSTGRGVNVLVGPLEQAPVLLFALLAQFGPQLFADLGRLVFERAGLGATLFQCLFVLLLQLVRLAFGLLGVTDVALDLLQPSVHGTVDRRDDPFR